MSRAPKSTVIIPAFNNAALTKQCLAAVLHIGGCEVVVVDDASSDGTLQMLATFGDKISVIAHKTNQGFAKTCNDGAKVARTEFVVFLNNDTIPQPRWLCALENYAKEIPKAAVVGSKLLYPNHTIQHAGVVICQDKYPRHIYTSFPTDHPAVNQSRRFQIVTAAAMLVRRKVFAAARGFDTKFQNGFEDVDLCLRLGARGNEIHYCAESVVQHFESVSPGRFKRDKDNVALYRKRWLAKVQPDDVKYFLADGLLELNYEGQFPLHLKVAAELAIVDAERANESEKSLATKSRQVADLTREVTKLRVELGQQNPASQSAQADRERNELRGQVRLATPPDAKILVVSKGDSALLELDGRDAQHFPQTERGVYLGHHPADSAEAITRLDRLRERGAEYLLFPATSFWWLEHYAEFTRHLETIGSLVQRNHACVTYSLRRIKLTKPKQPARVIALITARNEERFIGNCLNHLIGQGVQVYLFNHGSTDCTVEIANAWLGRGLVAIENLPAEENFALNDQLARHVARSATLDADWFLHADADEIHFSPEPGLTLAEAFAAVDAAGYNAVNFQEFTFIPTAESPDHDHANYLETMRHYYPFLPRCPWGVRALRRMLGEMLTTRGGHQPEFGGMRLCPQFFPMKHYQFLSVAHAAKKYGARKFAKPELDAGMHGGHQGWRAQFGEEKFALPPQSELRELRPGPDQWDASRPHTKHYLQEAFNTRAAQK